MYQIARITLLSVALSFITLSGYAQSQAAASPDVFVLAGYRFDTTESVEHSFTRFDTTVDFMISEIGIGVRGLRESRFHQTNFGQTIWSVGPHASYVPHRVHVGTPLGSTQPYLHGGVSYTQYNVRANIDTEVRESGLSIYAGIGVKQSFYRGIGLFVEGNVLAGQSYLTGHQTGEVRFGLAAAI